MEIKWPAVIESAWHWIDEGTNWPRCSASSARQPVISKTTAETATRAAQPQLGMTAPESPSARLTATSVHTLCSPVAKCLCCVSIVHWRTRLMKGLPSPSRCLCTHHQKRAESCVRLVAPPVISRGPPTGRTLSTGHRDEVQPLHWAHWSQPSLTLFVTCTRGRESDTTTSTGLPVNTSGPV